MALLTRDAYLAGDGDARGGFETLLFGIAGARAGDVEGVVYLEVEERGGDGGGGFLFLVGVVGGFWLGRNGGYGGALVVGRCG